MSSHTIALTASGHAAHHRPVRSGLVLAGLSLAILLSQLGTNIVNVALPTLVTSFSTSFGAVQWVVVSYLLVVTALIVGVGHFGDQLGKKRLYLWGLAIFMVASTICALSSTLPLLIAGRAAQGLGGTIIMALSFAFIGEVFPRERTGFAMGVLSTMVSFGIALGPSLGSLALAAFGWQAMFWLNLPFGILAYLLVSRYLPASVDKPKHPAPTARFDWLGTVLLAATLGAYSLAMTFSGTRGFGDTLVIQLAFGALIGLSLFLGVQVKAKAPLLRLSMFRNLLLSTSMAMSILVYAVMMATLVLGPFFLSKALGLNTRSVGLVMTAGPLAAALMGVPAGFIADRIGAKITMVIGLALFTIGSFVMSWVTATGGVTTYIAAILMISIGLAFFQTPNNAAVMANARPEQRGLVSGLLALARNLGLITGASLMGAVFSHAVGDAATASPEAVTSGMRLAFQIATLMAAAAFLLALTTLRRHSAA
ncbi:EmrB/QacA subfamily drug resistance transporter [Agrobacterium tumefaciens]|uniref:EmrB/QacA subfamily drug resistance transporter n=1 Tax=Agrobacterium radiobacter TaxID=362 RepID=A0ABR6JDP2_AGRRD|nr:MFS transporter [Agrobacterium radiobacter]TGE78646.1 MFS transporter [Rhizobium sp. SEMIA 439]MBB4283558.1 EmrB/QacA subfamily drug resistance transporter [Agrobacterium radiobacter]MBB4321129.1 EmrB/QacA subfamily drug resistance transporter [Agrobacterium radiobacter]MBB4325489.1 EmrB/QacA subfamily drug resistance transporter [Agrobacterium radiobacter]MBB4337794.1 EmrB/QacA subfamily drug resistance transporter [Agrobacterium radiobacter]